MGAHRTASTRIVRWHELGLGSLIFTIPGAFRPFVVGEWAAGRISGRLRSEPAILHRAIAWLLCVSLIVVFSVFDGASSARGREGAPCRSTARAPTRTTT